MSKAFTSDDTVAQEAQLSLPVGRRPITAGGMAELRAAHKALLAQVVALGAQPEGAGADSKRQAEILLRRLRHLERRMELSDVVPAPPAAPAQVALGTRVEAWATDEERHYTYILVGPDEVDVGRRRVSWASPVGLALMGRKVGERAFIKRPAGVLEVVIATISADAEPA